jgi:hypothetical protein
VGIANSGQRQRDWLEKAFNNKSSDKGWGLNVNWRRVLLVVLGFVLGILVVILVNSIKFDNFWVLILAGVTLVSLGVLAAFGFVALWSKSE